ncbi:glycosyltransferase family 4 protein [Thermosulfurimonas dismutans]|uniref:Glycosyl transferase, group 1 n=1 Tax=Thermosulfurimonas dismutans TaxID=999894 RepID=A0A179D4V2_9BACT|nr:glycosyltransferase family 4 protein [Thermosulfurimonas dismutans]OAQ21124.1 Glycosyl transferase, group 1 [Thermosulfurimonas dismutans]
MRRSSIKLIIFPGYYVPHLGGLETHTDEFAKHLSADPRFEVTVFAPNIPLAPEFEVRHERVKVYRYPAFEIVSNYPFPKLWSLRFWRLWFSLYRMEFDMVMTRTRFFFNSFLGFLFAKLRLRRLPLIHVEHGSAFVELESRWKTLAARFYDLTIGKMIFRGADRVIAISQAVKRFVEENFLPGASIPVIYRGLELEEIERIPPHLEVMEKFSQYIKVCFVGRFYKWKGIANLITAYKSLPLDLKEKTVLLLVGYGEDEPRLKALAEEDLDRSIYFLGKLPFEEAIGVIKASDIYVHPSSQGGGLSASLLQAMACGLSIVASPYEGAAEVIRDGVNGILLKDNSPEDIKKGLLALIKEPEKRSHLGKEARRLIYQKFRWENAIELYRREFERLELE